MPNEHIETAQLEQGATLYTKMLHETSGAPHGRADLVDALGADAPPAEETLMKRTIAFTFLSVIALAAFAQEAPPAKPASPATPPLRSRRRERAPEISSIRAFQQTTFYTADLRRSSLLLRYYGRDGEN